MQKMQIVLIEFADKEYKTYSLSVNLNSVIFLLVSIFIGSVKFLLTLSVY